MALLLFISRIGKAEIRQWSDTKLYNVKYCDRDGKTIDAGDFRDLNQARDTARRFMTGKESPVER